MGSTSSRAILQQPFPPRKSEIHPRSDIKHISSSAGLVRNKLFQEVQCGIFDEKSKARNCISLLQVPSQSLQQEDVRSVLSMEKNTISRYGHNRWSTELF